MFPVEDEATANAVALLRAKGYAVDRLLAPAHYGAAVGAPAEDWARVVVIDTETTGNDSSVDLPIEVAAAKVGIPWQAFESGQVRPEDVVFLDSIQMLEDPGVPSSEAAQRTHKIDPSSLVGQSFDEDAFGAFIADADLMVAHNASFDREILERRFPGIFADPASMKPWVCTLEDIAWRENYDFSARTLDYLAHRAGFTYAAHRALSDCEALAVALTQLGAWADVYAAMRESSYQVWALNAPFEKKDVQKKRGYFWSDGSDGRPKAWARNVRGGRPKLLEELRWLSDNVYSHGTQAEIVISRYTAKQRYSSQAYALGRHTKTQLGLAMAQIEGDLPQSGNAGPNPAQRGTDDTQRPRS